MSRCPPLRRSLLAAVFLVLPAPGGAWEFVPGPYIEILAECYAAAADGDERTACIGEAARVCVEEEPRGRTESGRVTCTGIEAEAWDTVLEGEYQLTARWARAADAGSPAATPGAPSRIDALRAAQGAWEGFFEAEGRFAFVLAGQVAAAERRLWMIAERAIALRQMREAE